MASQSEPHRTDAEQGEITRLGHVMTGRAERKGNGRYGTTDDEQRDQFFRRFLP